MKWSKFADVMRSKVLAWIGAVVVLGASVGCAGGDGGAAHLSMRDDGGAMQSFSGAGQSLSEAERRGREAVACYGERRVAEAMLAADEAASFPDAGDSIKALAYKVMSLCHAAAHNTTSAIAFAEMALALVPDDQEAQGIYTDALTDGRRYRESLDFLESHASGEDALKRRKIPALIGLGEWSRAVTLTDSLGVENLDDTELLYRAYALAQLGALSPGSTELESLECDDYSLQELRLVARIYAAMGLPDRAEEAERKLLSTQDSIIVSLAESKIYEDLYSLEHSRRQEEEVKSRQSEFRLWVTIGSALTVAVLLVAVILVMRQRNARRRAEADSQLLMLSEELKRHREDSLRRESALAEMSARVDRLFRDHYEAIEMAANLLLDASVAKNSEKKIAASLGSIVDGCREPSFLRNLEQTVNTYRDNVIERLRAQLPNLSDGEMAIILYSAAGLTPRVMCLLTGLTSSALYNRKYRLKKRLCASDAPDAKEFIRLLE